MDSKAAPSGRIQHRSTVAARPEGQSFPWSNTTGNDSRNDAFKKGAIFAVASPSED